VREELRAGNLLVFATIVFAIGKFASGTSAGKRKEERGGEQKEKDEE